MVAVSETLVPAELASLRASIDNLDAALVYLLAERFRCTQQVGHLKARLGLAPSDPAREEEQLQRLRALALESGLDPVFAEKVLAFIIAEVIRNHGVIAEAASSQSAKSRIDFFGLQRLVVAGWVRSPKAAL